MDETNYMNNVMESLNAVIEEQQNMLKQMKKVKSEKKNDEETTPTVSTVKKPNVLKERISSLLGNSNSAKLIDMKEESVIASLNESPDESEPTGKTELFVIDGDGDTPKEATIDERQLRALSRKHLLIMIRDLETELERVKQEKENLIAAYNSGLNKHSC